VTAKERSKEATIATTIRVRQLEVVDHGYPAIDETTSMKCIDQMPVPRQ